MEEMNKKIEELNKQIDEQNAIIDAAAEKIDSFSGQIISFLFSDPESLRLLQSTKWIAENYSLRPVNIKPVNEACKKLGLGDDWRYKIPWGNKNSLSVSEEDTYFYFDREADIFSFVKEYGLTIDTAREQKEWLRQIDQAKRELIRLQELEAQYGSQNQKR